MCKKNDIKFNYNKKIDLLLCISCWETPSNYLFIYYVLLTFSPPKHMSVIINSTSEGYF